MDRTEMAHAMRRAGIPDDLYALPGLRDPQGWLDSYYLLVPGVRGWEVGVWERGRARLGAHFASEDEACRWLLAELVFPEQAPRPLSAEEERRSGRRTGALAQQAMGRADQAAAITGSHQAPCGLDPGLIVDHFGQESGSYLYADGTPFAQRSLPPSALNTTDLAFPYGYHRYEVVRPFTVRAGRTAPAFGQPGGGLQLKVDAELLAERPPLATIRWLLRVGYLRRVAQGQGPVQATPASPPRSEPEAGER
jgi:Tuberculosis necrotizing toxin